MRYEGFALVLLVGCATARDRPDPGGGSDTPDAPEFENRLVTISVAKLGTGIGNIVSTPAGIDCGDTCEATFPEGTTVVLTATATDGTTFVGWQSGCSGTGSCTISASAALEATFSCNPGTQTFNFTGALQTATLPECVKSITIDASGAQGGQGTANNPKPGGLGARVVGTVPIVGHTINVLVGGVGANQANGHGGGGGGSYVYENATDPAPLMVAGGGGGSSSHPTTPCAGGPGSATVTPTNPTAGGSGQGTAGVDGNGGGGGTVSQASFGGGGGGAGWLGNGLLGAGTTGGVGGLAPRNGGAGGTVSGGAAGGFGGGGSGISTSGASGGGGGYNGGAGGSGWNGSAWGCGMGGGSFNVGTSPINEAGVRSGNGVVIVTW
jgi:hypothetical protein